MSEKNRKRGKRNLARPMKTGSSPDYPTILETIINPDADTEFKKKLHKYLLESASHCATESINKMDELFDHYKIDKYDLNNRWYLLALNLATDHVPGFGVEQTKQSGRPREWDIVNLAILYCDVKDLKREREGKKLSTKTSEVCRFLSKRKQYMGKRLSGKTIVNLYLKSKESPFVSLYIHSLLYTSDDDPIETIKDFRAKLNEFPKN